MKQINNPDEIVQRLSALRGSKIQSVSELQDTMMKIEDETREDWILTNHYKFFYMPGSFQIFGYRITSAPRFPTDIIIIDDVTIRDWRLWVRNYKRFCA